MKRKFICIICPSGCEIEVEFNGNGIQKVEGNICDKGIEYVRKEIFSPERGLTTTVKVINGSLPLVSVKTSKAIPKEEMMKAMKEIRRLRVSAPVRIGDVLLKNVLGTGADVIATKNVDVV